MFRIECNMTLRIGNFSLLSLSLTQEMVGSGARFEFSLLQQKKNIINDPLSTKNMKNCAPQFDAKPPKLQSLGHVRKGRRTELDLGERGGLVPSLYLVSRTDYCPLSLGHLMSEKQI